MIQALGKEEVKNIGNSEGGVVKKMMGSVEIQFFYQCIIIFTSS